MASESLFPLMEDWELTTLGAACLRGGGNIQTGPFGSQLHASDYVQEGVPSIMPQNLTSDRISIEGISYISEADAKRLSKYRVQTGDIVYSRRGDVQRRALVRTENAGWLCGTGCLRVRFGESIVDPRYAAFYLSHQAARDWVVQHAVGATMPNLNTSILSALPFVLPPINRQNEIADVLSTLDDKIALNRQMNETLEALAQAIFKDWFVTFGPVRRKMEGATDPVAVLGGLLPDSTRATEVAALFPDNFGDDGLPEGWLEAPFSTMVEIIGGGTPKTSIPSFWEGDIPWFSVVDTPSASDTFVFQTEKSITHEGLSGSSARLIPPGTTIITARGTVGNLAISGRAMAFNQSCYALRSSEGFRPYFTYLATKQTVERLKSMAHGSVFSTITRQTFDSIGQVTPSIETREAFENIATPIFERISASTQENRTLAETRDYLLPKLMSGAICVGDAERLVR